MKTYRTCVGDKFAVELMHSFDGIVVALEVHEAVATQLSCHATPHHLHTQRALPHTLERRHYERLCHVRLHLKHQQQQYKKRLNLKELQPQ